MEPNRDEDRNANHKTDYIMTRIEIWIKRYGIEHTKRKMRDNNISDPVKFFSMVYNDTLTKTETRQINRLKTYYLNKQYV